MTKVIERTLLIVSKRDYSTFMSSQVRLMILLCMAGTFALGAQNATPAPPTVDNAFVQKQFGSTCTMVGGYPLLTADLDGDGVEDAVLAGRCTNPLMDQDQYNFHVIDPYNAFFGYGDPRITTQFADEDPQRRGVVLLVIHGNGRDAWRADQPKMKFVVINLPFKQIAVRKLTVKKKQLTAVFVEEDSADRISSAIFWDGKKYRYQPMGSTLD